MSNTIVAQESDAVKLCAMIQPFETIFSVANKIPSIEEIKTACEGAVVYDAYKLVGGYRQAKVEAFVCGAGHAVLVQFKDYDELYYVGGITAIKFVNGKYLSEARPAIVSLLHELYASNWMERECGN